MTTYRRWLYSFICIDVLYTRNIMKNDNIFVRISEQEKLELAEISEIIDVPLSQITREAIREKIAELKKTHPLLQQLEQTQANN